MNLLDLIRRPIPAVPWADGGKIPWHEPAFSARMLEEHLSQAHALASRRSETIDRHVAWIHETLLSRCPTRILDLGCGPGLYTSRLAALGHACTGIDFSPASIAHAEAHSGESSPRCRYVLGDVRKEDLGEGYGLAMFLFGEINVFRPEEARAILETVRVALAPGGTLLLEPHTSDVVERTGRAGNSFSTHEGGLFGAEPYVQFEESYWDADTRSATTRWWILEAGSNQVDRYAQTVQAYDREGYVRLMTEAGFEAIHFAEALNGGAVDPDAGLFVLTGRAGVPRSPMR